MLCAVCVFGQAKSDEFVLTLKIDNYNNDEIFFGTQELNLINLVNANSNGVLVDTIRLEDDARLTLSITDIGRTDFYAKKGGKLNISVDTKDFNGTIKFEGDGVEMSQYYFSRYQKTNLTKEQMIAKFKLNEDQIKKQEKIVVKDLNTSLAKISGVSPKLIDKEKRSIKWLYLNTIDSYERLHRIVTQNNDFKVSEGFKDELKDMKFNSFEDYMYSKDYFKMANGRISQEVSRVMEEKGTQDYTRCYFEEVLPKLENRDIRNFFASFVTRSQIATYPDKKWLYEAFMKVCDDEKYYAKVTKQYNAVTRLEEGNPSPKFYNYTNFNGGTTSLDDFKGKYVYIDCWATWCGPCMAEIPHLIEIEKEYHHAKNLVFVGLSLDSKKSESAWRRIIEKKGMNGVQLLADNAMSSKFVTDYGINGIPRFLLIDPQGNIVTANAPRPSQKDELIQLFEKCGIKKQ